MKVNLNVFCVAYYSLLLKQRPEYVENTAIHILAPLCMITLINTYDTDGAVGREVSMGISRLSKW